MKRFSKQEILTEINNGNMEVLVYLARNYFPGIRRLLRIRGFRDDLTPEIFSEVLAACFAKLKRKQSGYIDFETYFMNALNEEIRIRKENISTHSADKISGGKAAVVSQCVSILQEQSQALLFARMTERLSYEQIAERFHFSNAVIAQYEVNKAFDQLEGIVKLRMNISPN